MIHPNTYVATSNVGLAVYAERDIPCGTIVYAEDPLDRRISETQFRNLPKDLSELVQKYSYRDARGDRIVSWDHGKYVNHCCNPNCITTGWDFEIAIRDIKAGEEILDDYGLLNIEEDLILACGEDNCRKILRPSDFEKYVPMWDGAIKNALKTFRSVNQPLVHYLSKENLNSLETYLDTGEQFKSVANQRYRQGPNITNISDITPRTTERKFSASAGGL